MADGRPIYRCLSPLFWDDPGVQQLDAYNQLIAAHILTSRQTNGAGLFRFSIAEAQETLAKVSGTFAIRFGDVCDTLNWHRHEPSKTLYLPTWWKWNPPDNPKHLIGAMKCLMNVPQTPLLQEFASNLRWLEPNLHDTFRIRIGYVLDRYPIQEQEQESDQDQVQEPEQDHETDLKPPSPAQPEAAGDNGKPHPTDELFDAWNAADGNSKIVDRTESRQKKATTRLKNQNWKWREALAKFPLDFRGTKSVWIMDIDFFLRPDTVTRILEGKYDDHGKPKSTKTGDDSPARVRSRDYSQFDPKPSDG